MDQNFTGVVLWLSYFWTVFNGIYPRLPGLL